MLKKFFISMLGSMAALWLSALIFFFVIIFGVVMLAVKDTDGKSLSDASILYLDLSGSIDERASSPSLNDLLSIMDETSETLSNIIEAIDAAADDKKIKGIYINCAGSSAGIASRGEIVDALKRFKRSDKWIYAYADEFAQGDYYIASVADEVYLNPVGTLDVHGLSTQVMFYKNVLDRLGIEVNVVRVGSFKSAVEPYLRMDMSEESRLQTSVFLDQIWSNVATAIAENRGLDGPAQVNAWADSLAMTWAPEKYVQQKAVTKLCYRSEVDDKLRALTDTDTDDDLPLITPSEYLSAKNIIRDLNADSDHIAVLYAVGDIVQSGDGGIVAEDLVPEIISLTNDEHVRGLVLRVNSPGGSAFASEQIWKALQDFKATGKPFYVSMGDYAASGGYYISCGADSIFCDPNTITGSIGIFGIIPNANRLLTQKIGIGLGTVETNKNANFPSLFYAPTPQQIDCMQSYVERGYETFVSRVAAGRNISADSVKVIGGGRVWDGMSARKIGLVDGFGSLYDVVDAMAKSLDLDADKYVCYPKIELSAFETILAEAKKNIEVNLDGYTPQEARQILDDVVKIQNLEPLQARMEKLIVK